MGEGSHYLAIVRGYNSSEKRNRSWDGLSTKESEKSELSQTSVVQFSDKTLLLGLLRHVFGELEGVEKVERNGVGNSIRTRNEVREVTRLSSSHVMLVVWGGKLGPELEESDQSKDLPLGIVRDSIPKGRGVGLSRERSSIHLHGPREFDSVSMNDVSYESKHGNTSMLDLRMTEVSNCGFVRGSPELSLCEVKRVVESYNRVKLLCHFLQISLRMRDINVRHKEILKVNPTDTADLSEEFFNESY